jgi:hypothetical protein
MPLVAGIRDSTDQAHAPAAAAVPPAWDLAVVAAVAQAAVVDGGGKTH